MELVTVVLALAALAIATHFYNKRRKWVQSVDLIPGPPALPIIGNSWEMLWTFQAGLTEAISNWTQKYGGIYRLWFGLGHAVVVLNNPEDVEILLSGSKHIEKADVYRYLHPWLGEGLLTSKGQKWHMRRKLITSTFHFRILDQFVHVFDSNGNVLVEKLLSTNGKSINIHDFLTLCTLDIICETAMGTKVNAQQDSKSPYVSAVSAALLSVHMRSVQPWLDNDWLYNRTKGGKTLNAALKVLHEYSREVIESRRQERQERRKGSVSISDKDLGLKRREAFLDLLLEASDSAGAALSDSDIQEEVDTFMFGGHDTTAAAMSFIFYNLAANPEVQDRLAEEVAEVFGTSNGAVTSQDLAQLKYTERVIKESLRLYPSVPLFARRINEELPITGGYVIPAGTGALIACYQMNRNPEVFPDPEKFDPDRFLPENCTGRHPYAYVPFSAGPRNCIGQKFGMLQMKSTVAKVVRHCVLSLPRPGYKPVVTGRVILRAEDGVQLKVSPRKMAISPC